MSSALRKNEMLVWLTLILSAAFLLRFFGLDFQSYWYDELFSAYYSDPAHSFDEVVALTLGDVHPPLYQLAMWLSYKVFGYTEWAGRFPSALAGFLTVGVIYLLGRDLFNRRVGLYAAALAVANYYLVYYGQEARSYAFLYFLCSLSFLFFIRAFRSDSWLNVFCYALATLALIYTHYFGLVLLVAQGLCALMYFLVNGWSDKGLLARGGVAAGAIVLAVLPLVPVITGHADIDEFWITQPGPGFIAIYFLSYFNTAVLAIPMAILVAAGIAAGLSKRCSRWERLAVLMLLVWLFVGYGLPWLRGFIGQPVITDRNTIMLVVPFLLLAAYGIAALPGIKTQRIILVATVAYSVWHLTGDLGYYTTIKKNQYRETAAAMGEFDLKLPVYTLKFNDSKYNVYFTQQQSGLMAWDMSELEALLAEGSAPAVMWFADGHRRTLETDVDERYGLLELGRIKHKAAVAALMLDPAKAVQLTVQEEGAGRYSTAALPATGHPVVLIAQATGDAKIELVVSEGTTVSAVSKNGLPAVMQLPLISGSTSIKIRSEQSPKIWLIPPG